MPKVLEEQSVSPPAQFNTCMTAAVALLSTVRLVKCVQLKSPAVVLVLYLLQDVQASQVETENKQISKCSSCIKLRVLVSSKA